MATVRLGDFMQEKALNMRKWLRAEFEDADLLSVMDSMLVNDYITLGDECVKLGASIHRRDMRGVMLAAEKIPLLFELTQRIRSREDMHDKFWRYLTLFLEVTEQASFQPGPKDGTEEGRPGYDGDLRT